MVERTSPPPYPCTHPEMRPTKWNQPQPAPAKFIGCSHSYICPVCGWGQGAWPDPCDTQPRDPTEDYKEIPKWRELISKLGIQDRISGRYAA